MSPINRDQQRAAHAYRVVTEVYREGDEAWSPYKGIVMELPVVVLRCGLVAAVAWLRRQSGNAGDRVCRHLVAAGIAGLAGEPAGLLPAVCALPLPRYMVATREALKVAGWLRRAAQAMPERERSAEVR
jgi:CRISPR/Cas system CMR-associated protein Cmr5 small subunit